MELAELSEQLGEVLLQQQAILTTAESCTGGWLAQEITAVAGSSQWFDRGFVTYSNQAKQEMLGVAEAIIAQHGAVSEETVLAMVAGALQHSRADYAVAISGIAGPTGGSRAKPVGTVWIAWGDAQGSRAECFHFPGDRRGVRLEAVGAALQGLLAQVRG